MSSDEEINTFYLILKPVPEDIVISTVMRSLIEKKFPVKKIKRISNKVRIANFVTAISTMYSSLRNEMKPYIIFSQGMNSLNQDNIN